MAESTNSIDFESILKQQIIIRKNFNNMKNKGKVLNTDLLSCMGEIVDMNSKLIEVVKFLKTEQVGVKIELDKTKSYAEALKTEQDSSSSSSIVNLPDEILNVDSRLDAVEQESLSNVVSCQGSVIEECIKDNSGPLSGTNVSLKKVFVNFIRQKCGLSLPDDSISSVSIRGKNEKKHIRAEFSNKSSKIELLRTVRTVKPENLYINDYLTAKRSKIFYDLRQLKKSSNKLLAVFPWNASLRCKLQVMLERL